MCNSCLWISSYNFSIKFSSLKITRDSTCSQIERAEITVQYSSLEIIHLQTASSYQWLLSDTCTQSFKRSMPPQDNPMLQVLALQAKQTHNFLLQIPCAWAAYCKPCVSVIPYPASYEETFRTKASVKEQLPKDENALDDPASRASTELRRKKLDLPLSSLKCMNECLLSTSGSSKPCSSFRRES